MSYRSLGLAFVLTLGMFNPARAALTLEFVDLGPISASGQLPVFGPSSAPATTSLFLPIGPTAVDRAIQIRLRDNLYAGPGTGTLPWQDNGGIAGPGSLGLSLFFMKFQSSNPSAFNPSATGPFNAKVVDQAAYGAVTGGTNPPTFTLFGGALNFGSEPGNIPQLDGSGPGGTIALFNIRVRFNAGNYSGDLTLSDQNTGAGDFTTLANAALGSTGTAIVIDSLIFGGPAGGNGGPNIFSIPFTIGVPEPSSFVLGGMVLAGAAWRRRRMEQI